MNNSKTTAALLSACLLGFGFAAQSALADDDKDDDDRDKRSFRVRLETFQEVPAVSSRAKGEFRLRISRRGDSMDYELSYRRLEGIVTQAHIHFAQMSVNGGISVWLCGTTTNPGPAGTPTCPGPNRGTVTGHVIAANVIGPDGQGISAGEFGELLKAIRAEKTYANVHSTRFPGGEIRGQIK
jgi:hypothetical protein